MTERTVRRLVFAVGGLLALYCVVTAVTYVSRPRASGGGALGAMFATLRADVVTGVVVTTPAGDSVAVRRGAAGWTVNGLPADSMMVSRLLGTLAQPRVGDLAAKSASAHEALGISRDSAWRVEVDTKRGPSRFLLGTAGSETGGGYARLPDALEVYEISGLLRAVLTNPVGDWRDKTILRLDTAAVGRLVIERAGKRVEVDRSNIGWLVAGGGTAIDPSRVGAALATLARLDASGFPADGTELSGKDRRRIVVVAATGDTLAALDFAADWPKWVGRVVGSPRVFRIDNDVVDRLTPTREELQGRG